jgi:hypothetical protein
MSFPNMHDPAGIANRKIEANVFFIANNLSTKVKWIVVMGVDQLLLAS